MFTTLKLMNACTNKQFLETPFEELVKIYQNTDKISEKNQIIRSVFCRLFPMLLKIQSTFIGIDNDTRVSHVLCIIEYTLQVYGRTKVKCKFTTYLYNNLKNGLQTEETKLKSKKRCVWRHMIKNNDDGTNYFLMNTKSNNSAQAMQEFISNLEKASYLSSDEKDYCKCVLSGYVKSSDIEKQMNYNQRFDTTNMTNPSGTKRVKKRSMNDIKKSIQAKFEQYDRDLFYK